MNHAVIIHGWGADSTSNWFPWLKGELEKKGWGVSVPDFPNTQNPQLNEWLDYFDGIVSSWATSKARQERATTVLIGHSLGVPFILRWLERDKNTSAQVNASYFVSGFHRSLGIPEIENFTRDPFDFEKIKSVCPRFTVINSDNDPFIPREIGKDLAQKLGVNEIVEKNGDHLNAPGGYLAYPRLLKLITQ